MPPDTILDDILGNFTNAAAGYFPQLLTIGVGLLGGLIVLQIAATFALGQRGSGSHAHGTFFGIIQSFAPAFIALVVMDHCWDWGNDIINGGKDIGAAISGASPDSITPSGIYSQGLHMIGDIYTARSWGMWFHPIDDIALLLLTGVAIVMWLLAALYYLLVLLEAAYVVVQGPITLCWGAFEHSRASMHSWVAHLIGVAVKIVALLLMVSIVMSTSNDWIANLDGLGPDGINAYRVYYATVALAESIVALLAITTFPSIAGHLVRTNLSSAMNSGLAEGTTTTVQRELRNAGQSAGSKVVGTIVPRKAA